MESSIDFEKIKRYGTSIAILIFGLLVFHLFSTLQVFFSNAELHSVLKIIEQSDYLLMPNKFIMPNLEKIGVASAGGMFFTMTTGTITVFVSFGLAVVFFGFPKIRLHFYIGVSVLFLFLVIFLNYRGFRWIETLSFIIVPAAVFGGYTLLLRNEIMIPETKQLALHAGSIVLLAVILFFFSGRGSINIFLDFRDNFLMSNNVGMAINDYYYTYTLYPARVFKPVRQRLTKLCVIEIKKKTPQSNHVKKRLVKSDYLVVDANILSGYPGVEPDLRVELNSSELLLKHKGKTIVKADTLSFISSSGKFLKEFSEKTDGYKSYRKITGYSLKTGFPLFFYVLMHFCFYIVISMLLCKTPINNSSAVVASAMCLIVCISGFILMSSAKNYEISEANLSKALKSENVKERIAGLRYVGSKQLALEAFGDYDTSFKENYIPEKYWYAQALGSSKSTASYDKLVGLLDDPHLNVVCQALYGLGKQKKKKAIAIIKNKIATSHDWYVQWYAYIALKRLRWNQTQK